MGKVLAACTLVLMLGCTERTSDLGESKQQLCEQLRAHVVDMRVSKIPPFATGPTAEDLARVGEKRPPNAIPNVAEGHRAALTRALGDDYVASCVTILTTEQLACSLKAKDTDGLVSCQRQ